MPLVLLLLLLLPLQVLPLLLLLLQDQIKLFAEQLLHWQEIRLLQEQDYGH